MQTVVETKQGIKLNHNTYSVHSIKHVFFTAYHHTVRPASTTIMF